MNNLKWEAISNNSWIKINDSQMIISYGNSSIKVKVEPASSENDEQIGSITFKCSGHTDANIITKTVSVKRCKFVDGSNNNNE